MGEREKRKEVMRRGRERGKRRGKTHFLSPKKHDSIRKKKKKKGVPAGGPRPGKRGKVGRPRCTFGEKNKREKGNEREKKKRSRSSMLFSLPKPKQM